MQNWFDHFKSVFQCDRNTDSDKTFDEEFNSQLRSNSDIEMPDVNCDALNDKITNSEVIQEIKRLKNNKACGIDGIPAWVRMSVIPLSPTICRMFNAIFDSGYFPEKCHRD